MADKVDASMLLRVTSLLIKDSEQRGGKYSVRWKVGARQEGQTEYKECEGAYVNWNQRFNVGRVMVSTSRTVADSDCSISFWLYHDSEPDSAVAMTQVALTYRRKAKSDLLFHSMTGMALNIVYAMKNEDLDDRRSGKNSSRHPASTVPAKDEDDDGFPKCIFCNEEFNPNDPNQEPCWAHQMPLSVKWSKVVGTTITGVAVGCAVGGIMGGIKVAATKCLPIIAGRYALVGAAPGAAVPLTGTAMGLINVYRYECCGLPESEKRCEYGSPHVDMERARLIIQQEREIEEHDADEEKKKR